jgi:hypothetical protein
LLCGFIGNFPPVRLDVLERFCFDVLSQSAQIDGATEWAAQLVVAGRHGTALIYVQGMDYRRSTSRSMREHSKVSQSAIRHKQSPMNDRMVLNKTKLVWLPVRGAVSRAMM